jgi:hypothetical protein
VGGETEEAPETGPQRLRDREHLPAIQRREGGLRDELQRGVQPGAAGKQAGHPEQGAGRLVRDIRAHSEQVVPPEAEPDAYRQMSGQVQEHKCRSI